MTKNRETDAFPCQVCSSSLLSSETLFQTALSLFCHAASFLIDWQSGKDPEIVSFLPLLCISQQCALNTVTM